MYNIFVECDFMKRASFRKRALAYIIDMFLVGIIVGIMSYNVNTARIDKLNEEANQLTKDYVSGKVNVSDYVNNFASISYDVNKENSSNTMIYLVVCIGYFLIFQYLNDGASIGKKLMKIKIVSNDNSKVNFLQMFIRTSIVNDIITNMMILILVYMTSNMKFFVGSGIINFVCNMFIIISVFMLIFRKDNLTLNDMMSKSCVIEVR